MRQMSAFLAILLRFHAFIKHHVGPSKRKLRSILLLKYILLHTKSLRMSQCVKFQQKVPFAQRFLTNFCVPLCGNKDSMVL